MGISHFVPAEAVQSEQNRPVSSGEYAEVIIDTSGENGYRGLSSIILGDRLLHLLNLDY